MEGFINCLFYEFVLHSGDRHEHNKLLSCKSYRVTLKSTSVRIVDRNVVTWPNAKRKD
jgi:hypothetical protein